MPVTMQRPPKNRTGDFDPDFRFTVTQYQKMVAEAIISADAHVELLNGKVVNKMARNPPHDTALSLAQEEIAAVLSAEWYIRVQMAVVLGKSNQPEPDIAVVLAPIKRYLKQHPTLKDIGMLVEVADSSLLQDRRDKIPIYAGGRIPWCWIVNIADEIVEVYSDPKGGASPEYRKRRDYHLGEKVPVVLLGRTVGQVEVKKLFSEETE